MEYREAYLNEIKQIAQLHNELAYFVQRETKDVYWDFGELSVENISKHLSSFINNAERRIYIAKDCEKVVGIIVGEIIGCHLPISSIRKVGYIAAAYVLPEYRGKGIMKSLDNLICSFFREKGIKYVELNFISRNSIAKKSWNALGYNTFREQARKEV